MTWAAQQILVNATNFPNIEKPVNLYKNKEEESVLYFILDFLLYVYQSFIL